MISELTTDSVSISCTGGTFLSAQPEFRTPEGGEAAANLKRNIDALVVIGGDGFTGALKIAEEHNIRVIGVRERSTMIYTGPILPLDTTPPLTQ